jgi:hypothetical protein
MPHSARPTKEPAVPYGSAQDLPSIADMLRQLQGMKLLTRVIARGERRKLLDLEAQLHRHIEIIDGFYALLGPRHWIFHDSLNMPLAESLLSLSADEAERRLIAFYKDPAQLRFMVGQLKRFPELRTRWTLIERAQADFMEERFNTAVALLLFVMDGFVNDLDPAQRRGLHARDADEMVAWDSVVGHHMGLTGAHRTFVRTFRKSSTEEVFELYRHGIVHGMLVHYDNDVVASKAWNRLFAVADWATSRAKEHAPPKARPSLRATLEQLRETAAAKAAMEAWVPSSAGPGEAPFESDEVVTGSRKYLDSWRHRNYGAMAQLLSPLAAEPTHGRTARMVRDAFSDEELDSYAVTRVVHSAPAVATAEVTLVIEGTEVLGAMRWIRGDRAGMGVAPNQAGEWQLMSWTRLAMMNEPREPADAPPDRTGGPVGDS